MSRKSPHSRAVARLAQMLVDQGHDLVENGKSLEAMSGSFDKEGRLRRLAGMVVADVGHCILLDARSAVMRREMAALGKRIRAALRTASATAPKEPTT